ncbi:hypothetical protein [Streptomyces hayashii]|uniref:hypothetical protein n=1 Tax=Streptomyces hayashii TaxID=2839966 RepID=UPI00403CB9A5
MTGPRTVVGFRTRTRTRAARRSVLARHTAVVALVLALAAATGGCAQRTGHRGAPPASSAGWEGKEDRERAMRRADRALDAVEPEGAARSDSGTADVIRGLARTFATTDGPRAFTLACQAPTAHTLTVTLERSGRSSARDVRCGDRESDRFDVAAGGPFTVRIAPARFDGLLRWRLHAVAPGEAGECADDVTGCAG